MKLNLSFKPSVLADYLRELDPFISRETNRYYLCGIFVEVSAEGKVTFTATDGHKLIHRKVDSRHIMTNTFSDAVSFIMPHDAIKSLLLALRLKRHALVAEIIFEVEPKQALFFSVDGITIHSKPIDGTFPNYRGVIPEREHTFAIGLGAPQAEQLLKAALRYKGAKWCFGATEFDPVVIETKEATVVVMPMRV